MLVRPFSPSDADAVVALRASAGRDDPDFVPMTSGTYMETLAVNRGYDPAGHFVAVEDSVIVGMATARFDARHAGEPDAKGGVSIDFLPVLAGGGGPALLFDRVASYLRSRGAAKASLLVEKRCASRMALLEGLGFARNGYETHVMRRILAGSVPAARLPPGVAFRELAIPDEIPAMCEMYNSAFSTRGKGFTMTPEKFGELSYFSAPRDPVAAFAARDESSCQYLGFVVNHLERSPETQANPPLAWSYSLSVIPRERKRGIGRALMARSMEWMTSRGTSEAWLRVNWNNPDAVHLYLNLGYESMIMRVGMEKQLE